jgi:hypothetical protein
MIMIQSSGSSDGRKFPMGLLVATPGVLSQIPQAEIQRALARHLTGDWGDVCEDDAQANEQALVDGTRILSAYHSGSGTKFWVITEADRSSTCVLLPEEY